MNKKDNNIHTDKNGKTVEELEEIVKELQAKIEELNESWKRALADYKNLEKRIQEEKASVIEYSNKVLVEQLVPVLDNFEMLSMHTTDMGIKLSINEFRMVLEKVGLKEIAVNIGDDFNPAEMDAIDTETGEKNKITNLVRKGYIFKSKLIRPASVKVGTGQPQENKEK